MQTQRFRRFTIRVENEKLLELLEAVARRAYEEGYDDATKKNRRDPNKIVIPVKWMEKLR